MVIVMSGNPPTTTRALKSRPDKGLKLGIARPCGTRLSPGDGNRTHHRPPKGNRTSFDPDEKPYF